MSVRDRINSMNTLISEATIEACDHPDTSLKALKARAPVPLYKINGADTSPRSRRAQRLAMPKSGSDKKAPLQLPGMRTEKGGEGWGLTCM